MFSRIASMGLFGLEAYPVLVEADISSGLPRFDVVGMPGTSVSESRDRVRAAIKNNGMDFPVSRITINLAPADVRKEGSLYDLPILIALLQATRQLPPIPDGCAFLGEISLSGEIRRINGALPMVIQAQQAGFHAVFIPSGNAAEASVVQGIDVFAVETLCALLRHLRGEESLCPVAEQDDPLPQAAGQLPDFSDVCGQAGAKRALEIAAAGGHNVMMLGPPGSGKSMLAKRIPSILPDMTFRESLETTKLYSIAGALPAGVSLVRSRPFRAPHHSISPAGLSGGGVIPHPGELSLAHNGVLFLDELPEFSRTALEVMRQPVEDGRITISRVAGTLSYPCSTMLICAMNPCPCGYFGHPTRPCTCPKGTPARYLSRVSGPLLDRLDIHIEVPPVEFEQLSGKQRGEPSQAIRERVNAARRLQQARFAQTGVSCNAQMNAAMTHRLCDLSPAAGNLLKQAFDRLGLSARAYDKILRIARTIADLDNAAQIGEQHVAEAVQYRSLDRKFWSAT